MERVINKGISKTRILKKEPRGKLPVNIVANTIKATPPTPSRSAVDFVNLFLVTISIKPVFVLYVVDFVKNNVTANCIGSIINPYNIPISQYRRSTNVAIPSTIPTISAVDLRTASWSLSQLLQNICALFMSITYIDFYHSTQQVRNN